MWKIGEYDIKDVQNVMLDILSAIDAVCRKHNIRYVLDGGTMLGAVRHQGFIPWDDDADIIMMREDYERFIDVANKELSSEYRFECMENTPEYPYNFGKVRAVNTIFREKFTCNLNINHGVYVDIFPMDDVENVLYPFFARIVSALTTLRYCKLGILKKRAKHIPFLVLPIKTINKISKKVMMYHYRKSDMVRKLSHQGPNKPPIPKTIFTDTVEVPYEDRSFFIPREFHEYLTGRYGDYMKLPPEEKRVPCHNLIEVRL